jgi:hypothetical protein
LQKIIQSLCDPNCLQGDAEFESWQKIFEAYKRNEYSINAQFLKVSHHHSHDTTSDKIVKHIFGERPTRNNTSIISTLSGVYGKKNEVPSHQVIKIYLKKADK